MVIISACHLGGSGSDPAGGNSISSFGEYD